MLENIGLDPEDTHESENDPIGIGNLCGRKINEHRDNDGMNSKGDIINGPKDTKYNREPFSDYTGYQVTSADSIYLAIIYSNRVFDRMVRHYIC